MGYLVLWDPAAKVAVLACDDPPVALGPMVQADEADEAVEVIQTFVEALPADVTTIPYARLIQDWSLYIAAIYEQAGGGERDKEDAPSPGDAIHTGDIPPTDRPDPLTPVPYSPESEADDGPTEDDGGNGWAASRIIESEQRQAQEAEQEPPKPPCWACKGSGQFDLPTGPVPCSACGGTGHTYPPNA